MKRYYLTVLIILILSSSVSASWNKGGFSGELSGHIEYAYDQVGDYSQTEVQVGYIFGWRIFELEPYAAWRTMFQIGKKTEGSGLPFNEKYTIGAELRIWKSIYFRVEHECTHHVITSQRDIDRYYSLTNEFHDLYNMYREPNHTQFTIGYYF